MFNPGVNVLLRVEYVESSISLCRRRNQLHQSASSLVGPRLGIPVRFRFNHRADQCRIHAMPVRSLANEFLDSVAAHIHGRAVASRKRRFGGHVDVRAGLCGRELGGQWRFSVHEKLPSRIVRNLRDLAARVLRKKRREENRAKCQRRSKDSCRDVRSLHHPCHVKSSSAAYYTAASFEHCRFTVNAPSVLVPPPGSLTRGEWPGEGLAHQSALLRASCLRKDTVLRPSRLYQALDEGGDSLQGQFKASCVFS